MPLNMTQHLTYSLITSSPHETEETNEAAAAVGSGGGGGGGCSCSACNVSSEQATGGERIMQGHKAALLLLPAPTLTKAVTFFTAPPRINDCRTCGIHEFNAKNHN
jgi:hypothetical protein